MAIVVPFTNRGGRIPQALTEGRLRAIAGLEAVLSTLREEAYEDLAAGMPYLGTDLRLAPKARFRPSVLNAALPEAASQ